MAVGCLTRTKILNEYKGAIVNNIDGSLTVYLPNLQTGIQTPQLLTKPCCEALNTVDSPTYFDVETQQCKYTKNSLASSAVNIVLNPKGGDGEWFNVSQDETCTLSIDFDYLFKFTCDDLKPLITNTNGVINMLENISASMILDVKVDSTTYLNVFEEPVFTAIGTGSGYTYFSGVTNNSGFYLCGSLVNEESDCLPLNLYSLKEPNGILDCSDVQHQLINGLFGESGLPTSGLTSFKNVISKDAFASNWLHFHTDITSPAILSAITNQKIVLTLRVSGVTTNISVLFDNIQLNKSCTKVDNNNIFITKSPGFDLDKLRDNKKSWATKNTEDHRQFYIGRNDDSNQIRETDYLVKFDDRQVINSKEIELDIDIAAAVETDVWCYISDNPCILTGLTVGTATCIGEIHAQVYTAQTITGISISSVTTTGTCCPVTAVTSTTITTSGTVYSCPVGYTATTAHDQCQKITTSGATFIGSGTTITAGNTDGSYGSSGAYFYPEISTLGPYPLYYNGSNQLKNNNNVTINPLNVSNSIQRNNFWWNSGNRIDGRLNKVGIWAPTGTWVGFSQCINITNEGTYYVGLAADNFCNFSINGALVVQFSVHTTDNFNHWSIFPVKLKSGLNIIQMEGKNSEGVVAFGAEIYSPTSYSTLTGATSTGSTQANVIFTTANKIGQTYDFASDGSIGYTCPSGFILNTCGVIATCTKLENSTITATTTASSITTTGYCTDLSCVTYTTTAHTTTISAQTATTLTGVTCGTGDFTLTAITVSGQTIYVPIPITGNTYCCSDSCGDKPIDINKLLTQPLSAVTTIEDFEYYLTSELIDVKNRQSITSYPTLRLLYDRYMSSLGCSTKSSGFDYFTMDKFGKLIGNYWVDLVEQVIPATTIWGSTKIYTNTIFDAQKYKYKSYTSLFGLNLNNQKVLSPTNGDDCTVDITTTVIKGQSTDTLEFFNEGNVHEYNNIYLIQMNSSPEYIGNVNVTGIQTPQVIIECTLIATIPTYTSPDYGLTNGTATAIGVNAQGPVTYLWSNGQTTKVATGLSGGTYSVTITDSICSSVASITITACTVGVTFNVIEPNYLTNNGSITATTINAQGPVTYLWNNGKISNILTGLTSSTYTVTVTDSVCSHTQSITLNDITNFAWRPYDTSCERETTFTVRKVISGSSSPSAVFYDTGFTPNRVWVADLDDYIRGNIYWFDPITATTEADMHYIPGLSADSLYNRYDDDVYRRLYFVGTNTVAGTTPITGLVVYDIGLNKLYQIPYGSSSPYYRIPLFVNDTNIYVVDKSTSPVTIKSLNRLTLTSASTFTTIVSDNGFNEQVQFTQVGDKIWTLMYGDTNHARINIFDNNFNHLNININGTTSSNYLVSSVPFGSGVLRTGMFYDKDYDTIYVSDIGTNTKIIITGASTMHYTGGTATTHVMTNYIISGKPNIQMSWSIDPVSNRLYENHIYLNSVSDTSEIYAAYEVDRVTNQFKKMFNFEINNVKPVNDGLSDSLMTSNPNVVWWNNHTTNAWNNDGTITFYNNSISGGTTGLVDILTTEKYDTYTNKSYIPSTILPNISGNTNYVTTPVFTLTGDCAVHYTYECPLVKWTTGYVPTFELFLDASVALNPNLSKILVSGYYTGSPVSNRVILSGTSGFSQYYMSTLTGASINIDSIHVTYYSGGPVSYTQVSACTLSNFS